MAYKKFHTLVICIPLSVLLCSCMPIAIGGAAVGGYYLSEDDRPLGVITEDAATSASVKASLFREESINGFLISVETYNSVVTLYGKVPDIATEQKALLIARSTSGVRDAISKLAIIPASTQSVFEPDIFTTPKAADASKLPEDLPPSKKFAID